MKNKLSTKTIIKGMPKSRLAGCIVLIMFCLLLLLVSIIAFSFNPVKKESELTNLKDNHIVTYKREVQYFNATENVPYMTIEQFNVIKENYKDRTFSAIYAFNGGLGLDVVTNEGVANNDLFFTNNSFGLSPITQELLDEFKFEIVEGKLPTQYNEIALPIYLAEKLSIYGFRDVASNKVEYFDNIKNLVGTYISLGNDTVKIVGVLDTGANLEKFSQLKETTDIDTNSPIVLEMRCLQESVNNAIFVTPDYIDYYFYQNAAVCTNYPDNVISAIYTYCDNDAIDVELIELSYRTNLDRNFRFARIDTIHENVHQTYVLSREVALISLVVFLIMCIITFAFVYVQIGMSIKNCNEKTKDFN